MEDGKKKIACALTAVGIALGSIAITGCAKTPEPELSTSENTTQVSDANSNSEKTVNGVPTKDSIQVNQTLENSESGKHVIEADNVTAEYTNVLVKKSGDSPLGDEADFYGDNSAVFATNGANLSLDEIIVETAGTHANALFSYGEGTTLNVSDSVVETSGNCSGGIMTTGSATLNATNLRITTSGNSSAAIRSDRGGGDVNVDGGIYSTSGKGSPAIYSTAEISVKNATLESNTSQGIVIEGKNSVELDNTDVTANNTEKNSDKSSYYQAVMIYQSMSGDAAVGASHFTMNGGNLINQNGDVFFVNNTTTTINLNKANIVNNDSNGVFLRAAAAGWGKSGSNGGQVTLNASEQTIDGDIVVDEVSSLNLKLDRSVFNGAINSSGQGGSVYVEISAGSTWNLSADSYITSLTCSTESINLNGHTLYVNGVAYTQGNESTGVAIEQTSDNSQQASPGNDTPPAIPAEGSAQEGQVGQDNNISENGGSSQPNVSGDSQSNPSSTQGAEQNKERKAPPEKTQKSESADSSTSGSAVKEKPSQKPGDTNSTTTDSSTKKEKKNKKSSTSTETTA